MHAARSIISMRFSPSTHATSRASTLPPYTILRVGGTVTVDDRSEIGISIPKGAFPQQPIFDGAAGRANVGLCRASSLFTFIYSVIYLLI